MGNSNQKEQQTVTATISESTCQVNDSHAMHKPLVTPDCAATLRDLEGTPSPIPGK